MLIQIHNFQQISKIQTSLEMHMSIDTNLIQATSKEESDDLVFLLWVDWWSAHHNKEWSMRNHENSQIANFSSEWHKERKIMINNVLTLSCSNFFCFDYVSLYPFTSDNVFISMRIICFLLEDFHYFSFLHFPVFLLLSSMIIHETRKRAWKWRKVFD